MGVRARIVRMWESLVQRDRAEAYLREELDAYVELLAEEYEREGMTRSEARRAALVSTGGVEQVREATRDEWVGEWVATFARELRYGARTLRRSSSYAIVAVLTLAIGIGGATAVFTVIKGSLLRPLPGVSEPGRLVTIDREERGNVVAEFSYADYRDLRDRTSALEGLAAFNGTSMSLGDAAGSSRVWVGYASHDFFDVLGVEPALGRVFESTEYGGGGADVQQVAVLGHALWQSRFGGSADVIGTTIELDDEVFTIIGVAPRGFMGAMAVYPMDLWIPITAGGRVSPVLAGLDLESRRQAPVRLVGRLAPGRSAADAEADLAAIAARLAAEYPTNRHRGVHVRSGAGMTSEERAALSRVPQLLALAVVLLLLIACANVAGLALVRSAARRREIATRVALGASRGGLARQFVVEGVLVAVAAGLLGFLIARLLVRSGALVQTVVPIAHIDLAPDWRVLGVAIAASALTAVLLSLVPAVQMYRVAPGAVLKDGGGAIRRGSSQRVLVAAQVAASTLLLACAAIVFSAFRNEISVHYEREPGTLTDVSISVRDALPDGAARTSFFREVLARAEAEPAIAGAALTSSVPPFEWSSRVSVFRQGEAPPREELVGREHELGLRAMAVSVSDGFFDVVRLPLVRGRAFTAADDERSAPVVIVSRSVADALWPDRDPIGRLLSWPAVEGPDRPDLRVVGVAADARGLTSAEGTPVIYLPFTQRPNVHILIARSRGAAPVPGETLRHIVADVNVDLTAVGGRTLLDRIREQARPQLTASAWIGVFGIIAVLLAAIGLYGVIAQNVIQRTRELAVRTALGATPRTILTDIARDGLRITAIGAACGALAGLACLPVLRSLFSGIRSVDTMPAIAAAAALAAALLVAILLPARRAARLQPLDALRSD